MRRRGAMSTLPVRDVPEDVRRMLKDRAAAAGQSLSEYVLTELSRLARQPTLAELTDRIERRGSTAHGRVGGRPASAARGRGRDDLGAPWMDAWRSDHTVPGG
ncbi:FitA-like ribbon-helix-helix domain-containing protein [Nakamurella leprariae]|uniref:FitA-like ribbon-helix-helix domain-containing protein n=1 Tax=Nakamurella leprariae TaxID=2803911 RepID=UPI0038B37556